MSPMTAAVIIFILGYIVIASEKVPKTLVALFGGFLMIVLKIVPEEMAFSHYIDYNVIFLLMGMMFLVKVIQQTGLFEYLAIKLSKMVGASPVKIMIALFLLTAIVSAFLDNVTTVLLISPISILIAQEMSIDPIPFLITQVIGSNIGGTATLIGDPPNILIGSSANLSFNSFLVNLTPVIVIQLLFMSILLYIFFRKRLKVSNEDRARIMSFNEKNMLKEKPLMIKSLIVFTFVFLGLFFHGFLHLEASIVAFTGAIVLLLIAKIEPEEAFKDIEWTTLYFFIGLFIMVGGLIETGAIKRLSEEIFKMTGGDIKKTSTIILWFSGFVSGIIDNIPYVATVIPLIKELGTNIGQAAILPVWWSLALGACLGGNFTIIGASANVVVAGIAKKNGYHITFAKFLKYGIPITFLSLLISYIYILIRYF